MFQADMNLIGSTQGAHLCSANMEDYDQGLEDQEQDQDETKPTEVVEKLI